MVNPRSRTRPPNTFFGHSAWQPNSSKDCTHSPMYPFESLLDASINAYKTVDSSRHDPQEDSMGTAGRVSRVDNAYDRLKAEILANRLPPGFQGTELEIAQSLDMSRTPVREALIRLQSEGLIELVPRRGVRVLPIAPNDMREIYQLLTILEPESAADVAKDGLEPNQLAELEAATVEMEEALKKDDLDDWAAADDRFHRTLLACNRNSRLGTFVNTLFDQAHRARMITLRLREKPWKSTEEHRSILSALAEGNPARTRQTFRAHRERAATELVDVLEKCRLTQL